MSQDEKQRFGRRRIRKKPVVAIDEKETPGKNAEDQNASGKKSDGVNSSIDEKHDRDSGVSSHAADSGGDRSSDEQPGLFSDLDTDTMVDRDKGDRARAGREPATIDDGYDKRVSEKPPRPAPGKTYEKNSRSRKVVRRPLKGEPEKKEKRRRPERGPRSSRASGRKIYRPRISVVIPAYNEYENIPKLIEHLKDMLDGVNYEGEVVFVDDGSTDNTASVLDEYQGKYKFLRIARHRINRGLTAALETGINAARGEILVFYPADLQYLPNDIPKMVARIDEGADFVCGWRQGRYGFFKSVISYFYNGLSRLLFGVKVHDLNSVKAFKREVVDSFEFREGWHRYMAVMAHNMGYNVDEVKVKLYPREFGKSKFGFRSIFVGLFDMITVRFQLTLLKKPMLLFGTAGLLFTILGFLVGLWALYYRFVEHDGFRPLLFLVVLLILMGVTLFAIGFLAEVMAGIIKDLKAIRRRGSSG